MAFVSLPIAVAGQALRIPWQAGDQHGYPPSQQQSVRRTTAARFGVVYPGDYVRNSRWETHGSELRMSNGGDGGGVNGRGGGSRSRSGAVRNDAPTAGLGGGRRSRGVPSRGRRQGSPRGGTDNPHSRVFVKKVKAMGARGDWRGVLRELDVAEGQAVATRSANLAAAHTADVPPRPEPMTVYMYTACITAMSRCRRWKEALRILDKMMAAASAQNEQEEGGGGGGGGRLLPNLNTMSAVITACGRCGQGKAALEVLERMKDIGEEPGGLKPDLHCLSAAIDAAGGSGEWESALGILDNMRAAGIKPDGFVYRAGITACGNGGRLDRALQLLRDMRDDPDIPVDVLSFNAAITACGRCNQWETAVSLLREMSGGSAEGLAPNLVSYGAAIAACASCRQGDAALELLREMPIVGITPDSMTYTSAITACGRAGQWKKAVGLFREISMLRVGFRPSAVSYSAVITACGDCGQWEEALRFLREMPDKGVEPDVVCLNSAVTACAKCGRWEEALSLLMEMLASSRSSSALSPGSLLETPGAPVGAGLGGAHATVGSAERRRHRSGATLARRGSGPLVTLRQGSRGGGGESFAEKDPKAAGTLNCRPNVVTYNAAMQACGSAGRWREALGLLRGMLAERVAPNATSFTSAIAACGFAGEWKQARDLLRAVKDADGGTVLSVGCYNAAVKACGDAGRFEEAVGLLREMEADAKERGSGGGDSSLSSSPRPSPPLPEVTTYTAAITACGVAREYEQALLLLREMPTVGIAPTTISYNAAITACSRSGQWELSLALLREMSKLGVSPDVISYNSAISALGSAGEWERAIGVLREMLVETDIDRSARVGTGGEGVSPDRVSFATVIRACEMSERFDEAADLEAEAVALGLIPKSGRECEGPSVDAYDEKNAVSSPILSLTPAEIASGSLANPVSNQPRSRAHSVPKRTFNKAGAKRR